MEFGHVSSLKLKKIINTFFSREMNVLWGDINIDFLKLDTIGKFHVDMMISSSLEQHLTVLRE